MTQDEKGIPGNSEQRVAIAKKITEKAEAMGILVRISSLTA
jgi:hypothetical protein